MPRGDGGIREALAGRKGADQFFAAHSRLARRLGREAGDQAHDVVIINHHRGEEHKLEVELVCGVSEVAFAFALALAVSELVGRFQMLAFEAPQSILRQQLLEAGLVVLVEVGASVSLA